MLLPLEAMTQKEVSSLQSMWNALNEGLGIGRGPFYARSKSCSSYRGVNPICTLPTIWDSSDFHSIFGDVYEVRNFKVEKNFSRYTLLDYSLDRTCFWGIRANIISVSLGWLSGPRFCGQHR